MSFCDAVVEQLAVDGFAVLVAEQLSFQNQAGLQALSRNATQMRLPQKGGINAVQRALFGALMILSACQPDEAAAEGLFIMRPAAMSVLPIGRHKPCRDVSWSTHLQGLVAVMRRTWLPVCAGRSFGMCDTPAILGTGPIVATVKDCVFNPLAVQQQRILPDGMERSANLLRNSIPGAAKQDAVDLLPGVLAAFEKKRQQGQQQVQQQGQQIQQQQQGQQVQQPPQTRQWLQQRRRQLQRLLGLPPYEFYLAVVWAPSASWLLDRGSAAFIGPAVKTSKKKTTEPALLKMCRAFWRMANVGSISAADARWRVNMLLLTVSSVLIGCRGKADGGGGLTRGSWHRRVVAAMTETGCTLSPAAVIFWLA